MAEVIRMPRMSDTMTEGVIANWLKKVGDKVKSGDILAEVETDKATMELESYWEGTLLYVGVGDGESVPVDGVIAVIGKEGENYKTILEQEGAGAANQKKDAPAETQPIADGQPAAQPQHAAKAETGPSPERQQNQTQQTQQQLSDDDEVVEGRVKASPLAKAMAKDKGINLSEVKGSGDNGRIVRKDIENFKKSEAPKQKVSQVSYAAAGQEGYEDFKVSQMRKTIARRLGESKFSAPHFYLTMEVDAGRLGGVRKGINDALGDKVSFNDIIIRCVAAALKKHPKINASWLGDKIRQYHHVHIGVAIAVDEGLVVPVIRHADMKGIGQISQEVKDFAQKAKSKKLQPQEMEGNTFTISNLGMFGIEEFTAIINSPDACILAVGAIQEKPVVKNGQLAVGQVMKMTLSCDHRVVDGATGAQFLQTLKQYLEEPVTILA